MKRIVCILLILSALCGIVVLPSCEHVDAMIRFSDLENQSKMQELNGKRVSIVGFIAGSSPVDGNFGYLMSLPYQACPYCKPNSQELAAGALVIYADKAGAIEVKDNAVRVTGTLEVGQFTDAFGYQFGVRLTGVKQKDYAMDKTPMGRALTSLAADGTTDKLYKMFDYVYFLCAWPTYVAQFEGVDYKEYLFPADALMFIETDGWQYNYGYKSGYFDGIRKALRAVDADTLKDFIKLVNDCEVLAADALAELRAGNHTAQYVTYEGHEMLQYSLNAGDALVSRYDALYASFASCLAGGEN